MGICVSTESATLPTAKVILNDGELREYSRPVKAAQLLDKEGSAWFVCDADVMDFDGIVSDVKADDELRPGQLYFVLPVLMLRKPLHAEQIAALAAKASAALGHASPASKSRYGRRSALVFAEPNAPERPVKRSSGEGTDSTEGLCSEAERDSGMKMRRSFNACVEKMTSLICVKCELRNLRTSKV